MGVDIYVLDALLSHAQRYPSEYGNTLWLGRQGFHVDDSLAPTVEEVLRRRRPEWGLDDVRDTDPYASRLFQSLGSTRIRALDINAFEGADIIHDLNGPVPEQLHSQFDTIFDGGTLEHVFNIPVALDNVFKMLKPGGLFLSVNGANNQLGHGFYQFSPDLFWSFCRSQPGCVVETIELVAMAGRPNGTATSDPSIDGRRQEIGVTPHSTYLFAAARRGWSADAGGVPPQQSDYVALWNASIPG